MDGVPTQTAGVSEILANDWNTYVRDNFNSIKFGHVVCTSSTRPTGIAEGTMVYETDTNLIYVYNGASWSQNNLTPVGMISPFAGSSAPDGWLLCDGSAVSQTTYAALFAVVGSTYDVTSPGAGNFRVPDLRGRVAAGVDNMGGTDAGRLSLANTLGTTGGAETLPAHTHSIEHNHDAFNSGSAGGHGHTLQVSDGSGGIVNNNDGVVRSANIQDAGFTGPPVVSYAGDHQHSIDVPNYVGNSGSTGTGTHGVIQPTILLNYIIKA